LKFQGERFSGVILAEV